MQRWRLSILALGILVLEITSLFPRDGYGRLYFLLAHHRPYHAADLLLLWVIVLVVVSLLMVSLSERIPLNLPQRILLGIVALCVLGTVLFTPSSYGGVHFLFTRVRFTENAIDYTRLLTMWTSLGLASWSLFIALSDKLRQRLTQRRWWIFGAILFLVIGFFPVRGEGMINNPHLIFEAWDDEGDHRLDITALVIYWSLTFISLLVINKTLDRAAKQQGMMLTSEEN